MLFLVDKVNNFFFYLYPGQSITVFTSTSLIINRYYYLFKKMLADITNVKIE